MTIKVLLENLLRNAGNGVVRDSEIEALARWSGREPAAGRVSVLSGARAAAGLHRRARARSTWRRCARPWRAWAAIRSASTRWCRPTW